VIITSTVRKFITFTVLWLLQVWSDNLLHLRFCGYYKYGWKIYYIYGQNRLIAFTVNVITFTVEIYNVYGYL